MQTFQKIPSFKQTINILTDGHGADHFELNSVISSGNRKLPVTTAIFNMSSATHCPALALGLCKAYTPDGRHICYAMKAEKLYPEVLPYRKRQQKFWKKVTAIDFVFQFLAINSFRAKPWTLLRFDEAGDFHTQKCVDKAELIASLLSRFNIRVYCYTHRSDLDFTGCKNLIVNGSNFIKDGVSNEFRIIFKGEDKPQGWVECRGDCRVCNRCSIRGQNIAVKAH